MGVAGAHGVEGSVAARGPARPSRRALRVLVQRLDRELPLPAYALPGDAGADIVAAEDLTLAPGERAVLPTGLAIALPDGYAAFVHPRSGLAARAGLGLVNAPGTIDAGYRGEIKLIVINHDRARAVAPAPGRAGRATGVPARRAGDLRRGRRTAAPPIAARAGTARPAALRALISRRTDASGARTQDRAQQGEHRAQSSSMRPRRGRPGFARSRYRPPARGTSATRPTTTSRGPTSARCACRSATASTCRSR